MGLPGCIKPLPIRISTISTTIVLIPIFLIPMVLRMGILIPMAVITPSISKRVVTRREMITNIRVGTKALIQIPMSFLWKPKSLVHQSISERSRLYQFLNHDGRARFHILLQVHVQVGHYRGLHKPQPSTHE